MSNYTPFEALAVWLNRRRASIDEPMSVERTEFLIWLEAQRVKDELERTVPMVRQRIRRAGNVPTLLDPPEFEVE